MKSNIVIYGNIYTVDKKNPSASALAVKDGRFVYVGDEEGVKEHIDKDTEEIRYEEGIILPGFGEGHGHIAPGGTEALFFVHLNPMGTLQEHLAAIKEFAGKMSLNCLSKSYIFGFEISKRQKYIFFGSRFKVV